MESASRPPHRTTFIVGGLVAAPVVGFLAMLAYTRLFPPDPSVASASSGMLAFNDFLIFAGVAGLVALAPAFALVDALARMQRVWNALMVASLGWATATWIGACLLLLRDVLHVPVHVPAFELALTSPVVLALAVVAAWRSPGGTPRRGFLLAGAAAMLAMATLVASFAVTFLQTR